MLFYKMKTKYDEEADALYIRLKQGDVHHTVEIDENTILDLNKNNEILGVEMLFVKERDPEILEKLGIKLSVA